MKKYVVSNWAVFGLVALLTAGCATQPISNSEAVLAPPDRILNTQYLQATANSGEVTIKRDRGFSGSACSTRIFVNAKPVADINASEKIVLHLPEAEYIVGAWPNGMCGGGMSEVRAVVKANSSLSFRVGYGSNGDYSISPTAF